VATIPEGELNLATLRPKGNLTLRLMFAGGWAVLSIMGIIFTLVGIGMTFFAWHSVTSEKRYEKEGMIAEGTVLRKDTYTTRSTSGTGRRRRTRRRTHYRVYYTFAAQDGSKHSGKDNLSHSTWSRLKKGSKLKIQYLPSDPAKNRPEAAKPGMMAWLVVLFPIGFGGAGLVMLIIPLRRAIKHAGLLSSGTLTKGAVDGKRQRTDITINNRHPYNIAYTFALADGEVHTGEELVMDRKMSDRLNVGDPIGVIYLPTNPDKNAIFRDKWMKHFQAG